MADLHDAPSTVAELADFQANPEEYLAQTKNSHDPLVLTEDGHARLVLQDAAGYQQMLERLNELEDELDLVEAVRAGEAQVEAGLAQPFHPSFAELRARLAL